jgi:hypothetical protein
MICRRSAAGRIDQRSFGSIIMRVESLDQRDQVSQSLNAQLRPLLQPVWPNGCGNGDEKADAVEVFYFVRRREADRARRRKPQHPKAAPEQWMVRILNGDAGQGGDVALIGRGVR